MIWASMIKRCHNKLDKSYCRYGLKGIKVCKEWRESFLSFYSDMGSKPEGKSIDRIDNKKGYSKENCKWSTPTEQALNRGDFKNKTSKYKGVYFSKRNKKWAVSIKKNKKSHWGGYYDTEKQASYAYKKLWNKLYDSRKLI